MDTALLAIVAALLFVGALAVAGLAYQLMRQHGRILARLEALERGAGLHRSAGAAEELPVGAQFPTFRLPDPVGRMTELSQLGGARVLLVNWSPGCGFCDRVAAQLAELEPALRARNTEIVLVSSGNVDANRELVDRHGLDARVLLTEGSDSIAPFAGLGTPVAYLLDEAGRVARPLAIGADGVVALARALVGEPEPAVTADVVGAPLATQDSAMAR